MYFGEDQCSNQSNLSLYSQYYAEACNELAGPSPRHCAWAPEILLKKCCSNGEPLATLSPM